MMVPRIANPGAGRVIALVLVLLVIAAKKVWDSRADRVLFFQYLAFGSFFVGICLLAFAPNAFGLLFFVPMAVFLSLAGYFALTKRRRRRAG
jgi:FtsH-binding integral membrane protein